MIKIGSRGSLLALIQAELVKEILQEEGLDVKIIKISTKGDRIRDRKIDQINSKGVFVKEIECWWSAIQVLFYFLSNIDEKLIFAPALKAEDPRDVFVGKDIFKKMDDLNNALVGTGSNRRICQGRNYFLNIKFRPIRGNVETRIGKIEKENLDGVILAKAGLIRAGLDKKINFDLDPHIFVPSPCQGILGIEIRKEDENLFEIFKKHSHRNSQIRMESERAFQKELGADCSTPMGIFTEIDNEKITLTGAFAFSKNEKMIYERVSGKISDRIKLGKNLAKKLKRKSYKKIILAGAGIGPADNITIAVKKALDQADVIIYDRLLNQEILEPYKNKDLYYVGKSMGDHVLSQDEINKLMVDLAKSGKKVVRLKGGDPYVFGRGSEEALFIKENGLEFETLPGLTSGIVCLNTAGIPPTHRDISTSISFITGHRSKNKNEDFKKYAKLPGSLVFYMGLKNLPNIIKDLIDGGMKKDKKIAIISNGSSPKQKVYTSTIEKVLEEIDLEKIKRPAIIVISDTIGLREYLNYFENKNFGRKIALTRDYESGIKDKKKLEVMGFDVKIIPTIKIVEKNLDILEEKFKDFSYDYLVFTSKNAVKIFFDNLIENHDIRDIGKVKIVAIGEKTKKEIEKYNLKVDIVPRNFVGENLLDEMGKYVKKDDKIFFPHSNLSRKKIIDGLDNIGILDEVEIYDNIKEEKLDRDFDFDEIIFTSSSCVNNFVEIYGKEALNNKKIYSIGQITTKTIENHGLEVYKESKKQSMDFLMEKIGENHEDEKN
ncbi:MAG: uroporphyrinogen-III C-methyltransferase [Anaerococcus vaginalis]|uniref:uroporphyrinogen-III C-methyltransferase n=1 Tax=Anaerococcus vaginalis TaxID=33037 RepID=UPI0029075BC2|nr:uroporphyrinogen-III C-methyltransferase [Anaerococcus vaginalis]